MTDHPWCFAVERGEGGRVRCASSENSGADSGGQMGRDVEFVRDAPEFVLINFWRAFRALAMFSRACDTKRRNRDDHVSQCSAQKIGAEPDNCQCAALVAVLPRVLSREGIALTQGWGGYEPHGFVYSEAKTRPTQPPINDLD